ncbi:hypothetical protein [Alistipes putredinis]|jgi:hypothetical protein|uniref:hypothetical protein n=1 Tax=Alistipes putredinis TaxID=28117 RepID=UPI0026586FCC|nr:hypothetical protein [Alistipes putredinis]
MAKNNHTAKTAGKAPKTAGASVQTADVSMQVGNESPDLQPAPDTEPAAGKEAEPTPSVPEAPDTTPGLRPDSASDDESGTADRQTDDTPEELAARQATEAAAREAADRATTESGVGSRLKAEAGRILAAYPDAPVVYMTSNGFGFFRESEARNHAATLRDKAVITVKRK